MNPLGAILTLLFSAVVFAAPRRYALLGVIAATCYMTQGQQINIGGFHFTTIRLVMLVGIFRCFSRGEFKGMGFNAIDKCLVAYVVSIVLISTIRAGGATDALVSLTGWTYNILLPYFLFRALLKDLQEIETFLGDAAIVIAPFALFMMQEALTGRDLFGIFGGVGSMFRDGHYRSEAAFRSPITAGTVGATLMPFFVGLYLTGRRRPHAIIGMVAATLIVYGSRSSGPLLAYGSGLLALLLWRWREYMRGLRWGVLITLVSLHLYMKAPVWFLMGHMSDIVGGGGWYRAEIVDDAVNHFDSWWFLGTTDTGSWSATPLAVSGAADLTNQFVVAGVSGGLVGLFIFITIFVRSFRYLGLAMRQVRGIAPDVEMVLWALGAALYATLVNFFSVCYFDQIDVIWYLLLAMIASASFSILKEQPVHVTASDGEPDQTADFAAPPLDSAIRQ
jgi:hypothetical protein